MTITEGETYTVGNSTYDQSGVYYDILIAQNDCDSTIELTLTVISISPTANFDYTINSDVHLLVSPFLITPPTIQRPGTGLFQEEPQTSPIFKIQQSLIPALGLILPHFW